MTRTPEQILCCPGGCDHEGNACSAHNRAWTEGDGSAMLYRYISMSPPDRLTLARALLPDGWVVAKVPAECDFIDPDEDDRAFENGWNACRAAMLASSEAPNDE